MELYFENSNIDKSIPIPLYYQLKEILLGYIRKSDMGTMLPTEEQLCERYNISRPTVRQAIRELEISGYLYRVKGKGTFVSEPKINQDVLTSLEDFEDRMKKLGFPVTIKKLELKEKMSEGKISTSLNIPDGTPVLMLRRLIYANSVPMVLSLNYLPKDKISDISESLIENNSLYDLITKHYGYRVVKMHKSMEAKMVSDYEAELLEVKKKSPVQLVETISYLEDGTAVEYSMERYRADKNKFNFSLVINNH